MSNPVVLITGASSGIGKQLALSFAQNGYDVIINYGKSEAAALEVSLQCQSYGVNTLVVGCDVSDYAAVGSMIKQAIETFGKIDVLINNSGITKDNLILRMKEQDFDEVISVNLKGTFNTVSHVSKYMLKAKSGRIINMASVIGILGNAGQANYAASKGGIIAFTKSLAREFASRGITVNAIAPGFIQTKMTDVLSEEVKTNILKQIPLGRFGKAEDIAHCALFIASDKASYISGQVIQVDGGMAM
ncbi:MAG: 3-oxoacyl-(acyl-carrier-protein) reductase [Erysipelotrichaceae bacterium]|nr:MAG: 3-oxoacyl-(acyl-carrier-protein) [Erysipelotrichaceae bacterium]TXT17947.1 MAG: 3-oxoacyl-(acyl-carrier-protein) reductase [Erysipelotrichaceae bacterium]